MAAIETTRDFYFIEMNTRALGEFGIEGLKTTIGLHEALARDADIRALRFDTKFLERWLETNASRLA
jgi:Biotin carboxylase